MRPILFFLLIGAALACSPKKVMQNENPLKQLGTEIQQVNISLKNIACHSCGRKIKKGLSSFKGVTEINYAPKKVEVTISFDSTKTSKEKILKEINLMGYQGEFGSGKGTFLPMVQIPDGLDIDWISYYGEEVELREYLEEGKFMIFDFYATWCAPCRDLDKELVKILYENDDVAVRKVNVNHWDSDVAKKYLKNGQIPYLIIYNKEGKVFKSLSGKEVKSLSSQLKILKKAKN